jgi:flagellar hook-associated protein 1 FlgK
MSLDLALSIAGAGLAATQRALGQVSQNVANATSPGYTRKTLQLTAATADGAPLGVRVTGVLRAVDAGLVARLNASLSEEAATTLRERLLRGVEETQSVGNGAVPDAIGALQDSLIALRGAPSDGGLQRASAEAATTVARNLNAVSDAIGDARQQAQATIEQEVATANSALREIATLTYRLQAGVDRDSAATLEDQRDEAIAVLSQSMNLRAVRQENGGLLLLANGTTELPLDPDEDLFSIEPALVSAGSYYGSGGGLPGIFALGNDVTASMTGGRIGEAIRMRDTTLPRMQAEVDLVATHLAGRLEAQGLRLFTDTGGATPPDMSAAYAGSAQIGFAGRIGVNPDVTASADLIRDGTHDVTATSGGPEAFTANPSDGPAGFTTLLDRVLDFSFGAEAADGSAWAAIPNNGLGPDGSLRSSFLPPLAIGDYATRVMATQAADRAAATAAKEDAAALSSTLDERLSRESGVDVDEEMAAIVTLQNAYAANARVMAAVQSMWDSLLASVR